MASNSDGGTRKLAAIMFTDVKDFSKKMGENEIGAMDVLKIHDDTMVEIIAKYRGVVIKSLGDSFMVDFPSAVNAVQCAIEVEERFWEYNKDKKEFDKIQVRVGIHLGDVIKVGTDLYGDGVNIAARIEAITEANRICVSSEIYNQVKNKMPIKAFSLGLIELKNIAEPVEVFELLLESIPELSTPSESAKNLLTRKRAEQASAQEQEEAVRVEATKKKVDDAKEKEEAEKRERAGVHYAKALEHFQADQIAKAEEEIKEIYKVVQIHYEAQMLVIQIEERRAQLDEEERRQRVKDEKLRKEEDRKHRIEKCLDVALEYVDREQFGEALTALQEVYTIEPNNEQAKRIEKQVQLAEDARLERQRLESQAEEERVREEAAEIERKRSEELATAALQRASTRKEVKQKANIKLYVGIAAGVLVVVAGIVAALLLTRGTLQKPSVVAVLPLTTSQEEYRYLGNAFSTFVSEEVGRMEGMTAIAPTSSDKIDASNLNAQLSASLGVSHVLRGSLLFDGATVSVTAQCIELSEGKSVWESTLQSDVRDLRLLAAQLNTALMRSLDIELAERKPPRISESVEATTAYLRGLALMTEPKAESLDAGIRHLRESLRYDSLFGSAKGALSWALMEQCKRIGERETTVLTEATELARSAVGSNPDDVMAHITLGRTYRAGQQFVNARAEIQKALTMQPGNPEGLRELALLALLESKTEEALEHASAALKNDPHYFDSHRVKGIVQLFKSQYEDAAHLFDEATRLGAPDSLLTVHFRFRAWVGMDQGSRIVDYCQSMMNMADDRTKVILYYWIGRAYQLDGKIESLTIFDEGIQLADRVFSQNPKDYTTLSYYALLQARRGRSPETATRLMQRALGMDASSARMHYWSARLFAVQRNKEAALKELGKAVALEYRFHEVLDADFLSVWDDPQFAATVARKTQ